MKRLVAKTKIKREKGWLYFTGTDENGFITLMKVEMKNKDYKKKEDKEDKK